MNPLLATLTESGSGVVRRRDALAVVAHHVLDRALESGRLVRVLPRTYLPAETATDRAALVRAAFDYAGVCRSRAVISLRWNCGSCRCPQTQRST